MRERKKFSYNFMLPTHKQIDSIQERAAREKERERLKTSRV
jgi:hypothetical protein